VALIETPVRLTFNENRTFRRRFAKGRLRPQKVIAMRNIISIVRHGVVALALVMATATLLPSPAQAHERGWHGGWGGHGGWGWGWGLGVGVGVGALLSWPGYYYPYASYPYPYYAPPIQPVTVIQQAPVAQSAVAPSTTTAVAAGSAPSYYYCNSPKGYYPYVRSCKNAWQMIPATPPGAQR